CTPGIIVRLASTRADVDDALLAHLCRCTGWQTIREACDVARSGAAVARRDVELASRRAAIEGGTAQRVGPHLAVGGGGLAFGGKVASPAPAAARMLADEHGRAVRVVLSREDVVRLGPKRPPLAAGVRADGTGVVRVVRTPGIADAITAAAPGLAVEEVDVAGLPTSVALRAAGWAEAGALLAAVGGERRVQVAAPSGASA